MDIEKYATLTDLDERLAAADEMISQDFKEIIGQEQAKARARQTLLGVICENGFMPSQLYTAPPGVGKSLFMRVMKGLVKKVTATPNNLKGRKTIYFESGKAMKTPLMFFTDCLVKHVHDTDAVIFGDEIHEAKPGVLSLIRDCLEPDVKRSPKLVKLGDDGEVLFNPLRHSILIATNKIDMLDDALVSRFERNNLVPYSDEEMEQILFKGLKDSGIVFHPNSLRKLAECARGTGRDVVAMCNSVRRYLAIARKNTINKDDVAIIIAQRETLPVGVTLQELKTLILLEKYGPSQLQSLAAKNGVSSAEQKTFEKYLYSRGFLNVEGVRILTEAGHNYLAMLRESNLIEKADPMPFGKIS